MHSYLICGMRVQSPWPLSRLKEVAGTDFDLRLTEGSVAGSDRFIGKIPGVLDFSLGDAEVVISRHASASDAALTGMILGPIMALVMMSRGLLALHAGGAVDTSGRCLVFGGRSGVGKSTTVAAMLGLGWKTIGDDLVPIDVSTQVPVALPSYSETRLWPDVAGVVHPGTPGWVIASGISKRAYSTERAFHDEPAEIAGVFLIEVGSAVRVERLGPADAITGLLGCTWERQLLAGAEHAGRRHFDQVATLAESVPVWRLTRPPDLRMLSDLAQLVASVAAEIDA